MRAQAVRPVRGGYLIGLLGVLVLRDRPRPVQQVGLGLALAAIVLITR